ncbi:MAG: hypothetical protein K2J40_08270 [Ruminococcus sp.]|nr:hypothetical protein [Ruminococcus sp.]
MNKTTIILLKWLLLPVILYVRLIVVQIEGIIFSVAFCDIFCFYENNEPRKKRCTVIDYKVRMNN